MRPQYDRHYAGVEMTLKPVNHRVGIPHACLHSRIHVAVNIY
jgi:hypothetical protein